VIVAHHLGEELIPALVAAATTGSVFLALVRARLSSLGDVLRRRVRHR
jgi:hypothetical protein